MNIKNLLGFLVLTIFLACEENIKHTESEELGNWILESYFEGNKREGAVAFVLNETAYYGMGWNSSYKDNKYMNDFWKYSGEMNWEEVDTFPGQPRSGVFFFSLNNKGYCGGGNISDTTQYTFFSDIWEFNPLQPKGKQWSLLDVQIPDSGYAGSGAFTIGDNAYIYGGLKSDSSISSKCFRFNPIELKFHEMNDLCNKRYDSFSFVIDNRAYVGAGRSESSKVSSLEMYDPIVDKWEIVKAEGNGSLQIEALTRLGTAAFVVNNKGYITGGENDIILDDCWEYDPPKNKWTRMNSFEYRMSARKFHNSFVMNGNAYVIGGSSERGKLDDVWIFDPLTKENEND